MSVAFRGTEEYEIHDHDAGRHQCSQQHPPTSGHTGFPSFPVFTFMMTSHISNSNAAATSHNPRNNQKSYSIGIPNQPWCPLLLQG